MRIIQFWFNKLNVSHVHTSLSSAVEGDYPIVALGFVFSTEVVGAVRYLDGKRTGVGICSVYGDFANLMVEVENKFMD